MIFHYHHFYLADAFDRSSVPPTSDFPYASLVWPLYSPLAANAVEMFWLISGFVFAHVYLNRRATAWQFGVARFARLYPLHFATLVYVAALQLVSLFAAGHWQIYGNNDAWHFLLQLLFASNWTTWARGLSYNGPIWSVSLEIGVYVIFFLSLFLLRRRPLLVTMSICAASWAIVVFSTGPLPVVTLGVFRCAGYFFLGTLLYLLGPGTSTVRMVTLLCAGSVAVLSGALLGYGDLAISGFSVAALSLCARLDHILPRIGIRLSVLGDISYSVYLVHVPIQMTVLLLADCFFGGTRGFAGSFLTLPLYFSVSVLVAFFVHRNFERPAGSFIRQRLMSPDSGLPARSRVIRTPARPRPPRP